MSCCAYIESVKGPVAKSGTNIVKDLSKVRHKCDEGEAEEETEGTAKLSNKGCPGVY